MLRITMLKLKKAWSIALTLRNRGDTRFHRLMMVRTAQKSTNTDKDNEWKCKQIIDYLFSPLRTHSEIRRIQSIIISDIKRLQKAIDKKKAKEHHEKPECIICPKAQREKCNKLIAEIFGDQKFLDSGQVSKAPKEVETVFSTTAKQTEEQLAQKVEIIHETPMVEAEKPKIEGLNTPPRVLGQNLQRSTNFDGETTEAKEKVRNKFKSMVRRLENSEILSKVSPISHGVINYSSDCSTQGGKSGDTGDKQDEYDSIAKRHLSTPRNDLDKHLIKEMQHLGVPQGSGNSILDIQINPTKKPQKPSAKTEIELEARSNDNGYSFDNQQKEGSVHNKTLHNPDFVSKLHEEGIRYAEQMSSNCKETKEDNTKKETPSDSQNTEQEKASQSTPDNKKENSTSTSQAFRLSTNQLNPWSGKYPYFSGIPINQNMYYPGGYTQQKQQYDPNQPIIDPHDKKNIASDTETYGYEPLRNDMSHYTQQNKQTEQPQTVEPQSSEQTSKADPGVIPGLHLNRNMPYFYNYNLNYLHPNQQNFSSNSEDSTASQQYTNYTTEQQNIDAALDTNKEPQKTDQTNPANQTQASDPNLTSLENDLDRNRPYYYTQNYTYPGEQSNQHVLTSAEGELQKYHDAKITQQNEAVEQPKTKEQLPTAEPNTGYNNYLNRNMPYLNHYAQNSQQNEIGEIQKATEQLPTTQNYTYPGQQSNQNVLTSVEGEPQKYYDAKITPQNEAVEQPKTTEQLPTTVPNTGFNNYLNRNMPYLNHYAQNSQQNEIGESQKATEQLPTVDLNARYVTYLNRDMPYQNQDNQKTQQNKTIENTKTKQSETSNQNPEYNYYIKSDRPYLYNQNYTYFSQLQNKQDAWPNYKANDPLNHNKSNVIEKSEVKEQLHTENTDKPADQPLSQENTKTHPEEIKTEIKHMKDIIPYSEIYTKPKLRVNTKGEIQLLRKPEQHGLDPNQTYVDAYTEVKATDLKSDLGASEPVTKSSKSDSKAGLEKELRNALMSGADSRGSSYYTSADANPDNIILDQHTGDPSFDQTQHSTPDSDPHQHVVNASKETASTLANPENIALIKKLGDESHNQAELNNPWTYHYQYYQQNLTNLSKDTDADNIILDQNTGDPSYDQCPQEDTLKQNTFAKVEKVSDNIVPKFSNVIPQTNIWKQYLKSMDDSSITDNNPSEEQKLLQGRESESKTIESTERRPQYDAHRPLPDYSNNYENITEQQSNKSQSSVPWSYPALGSQSGIQQMFYPNTHPFQQPAGVHGQNPYYQSYTLYGKSPSQQNRADQKSRDGQTIDFYQHQQISTDKSTSGSTEKVTGMNSDQKPPILPPEMRPFITNPEGQTMQPLAGSSAGFVSLPKPKWDAGIFEKDESMPEEKVQVGAEGTISPLPELGTPLPKGEDIPLSELLRRVRQRNRQEALKLVEVDPFEGKCGTKKPPCPPPPPSCPKPKPPTRPPCPPAPPTCPRPCKPTSPPCPPPKPKHPPKSPVCPPKTTPACKCVAISLGNTIHNIFTQICDIGKEVESFSRNFTRPEYVTKAIMTEDVEVRTRLLGNSLCTTYSSDLGVLCQRLETLALVRGFEPWVPVPSWPYPVKPKKKPFIGPKEGCKERPPPKYDDPCDPPCVAGNPCQGFPNKYRKR